MNHYSLQFSCFAHHGDNHNQGCFMSGQKGECMAMQNIVFIFICYCKYPIIKLVNLNISLYFLLLCLSFGGAPIAGRTRFRTKSKLNECVRECLSFLLTY